MDRHTKETFIEAYINDALEYADIFDEKCIDELLSEKKIKNQISGMKVLLRISNAPRPDYISLDTVDDILSALTKRINQMKDNFEPHGG